MEHTTDIEIVETCINCNEDCTNDPETRDCIHCDSPVCSSCIVTDIEYDKWCPDCFDDFDWSAF